MIPLLTLFVDSSLCQQTKAGGWGAWAIRRDWCEGRLFGGRFGRETAPGSSREAETCGIANALAALRKTGGLDDVERVMIQCDCLQALELIGGRLDQVTVSDHDAGCAVHPKLMRATDLEMAALASIEKVGKPLILRHVYGHRKGGGRQWVNTMCDQIARNHMRDARALLREAAL